jgi:hypothetical protein
MKTAQNFTKKALRPKPRIFFKKSTCVSTTIYCSKKSMLQITELVCRISSQQIEKKKVRSEPPFWAGVLRFR